MAEKDLACFRAFVKFRKPVTLAAMAGTGRRQRVVVSDALQALINEQMGLKPDTFFKYNKHVQPDTFV